MASPARLSATFENGSGEVLAARRVAVLALWDESAMPPPRSRAARRTDGSKWAKAVAARRAPAGTRIKV